MTVLKRVSQKEMKRRTGFGTALGYALPEKDEILIVKDLPKKKEKEVIAHEEQHIARGEEGPFLDFIADIFGASKQSKEAKRATKAQAKAAQAQLDYAKETRDLARADYAPYRQAGYTALDALMSMTGLAAPGPAPAQGSTLPNREAALARRGIDVGDYLSGLVRRPIGRAVGGMMMAPRMYNQLYNVNEAGPENVYSGGAVTRNSQPQTIEPGRDGYVRPNENPGGVAGGYSFMTDPGYEFRLNEGYRGLERGAAAAGGLLSGGYGRRAIRYGQDYASNEYTNVYNRIAAIAGIGQTAAGGSANTALATGQMQSNAAGNLGYARASGYTAQGNIWGNAISSAGDFAQDWWKNRKSSSKPKYSYTPGDPDFMGPV